MAGSAQAQVPTTWKSVGVGGGGSLFAPTFNPFNSSEMWLACDMSGQYHSTNSGASWGLNPFTSIQVGPYSPQVQFTSNAKILYDVDTTGDNLTPVKSSDGGTTWKHLAN